MIVSVDLWDLEIRSTICTVAFLVSMMYRAAAWALG